MHKSTSFSVRSIKAKDVPFITICLSAVCYFAVHDPLFISALGCFSILFLGAWHLAQVVPILEQFLSQRIRFWHIASLVLAATALVSIIPTPAHAIFLSGLEDFFKELVQGAQSGTGSATLSPEVIELIFNLIRGTFLLIVAASSLFAYNQAQQGNDWRPIVTQVGLAFAIVIAVDIVTYIFVGDGVTT
jgi:hypothetical protein